MKQVIDPADLGLVIVDIHLSDDQQAQAGIRLFERWTATVPALPFLFISDNVDDAHLPAIYTGGGNFLAKPHIRQDVLEAVTIHLSNRPVVPSHAETQTLNYST